MITPNQLFKLMKEYGVQSCEVSDPGGGSIHVRMSESRSYPTSIPLVDGAYELDQSARVPRTQHGGPSPHEEAQGLDNSAVMPEYNGEVSYKGASIYDDPDLYPEGVDPVADLKARFDGIRSDINK